MLNALNLHSQKEIIMPIKKKEMTFELTQEFIELIKLLKLLGIADTGGDAKSMVDNQEVYLNKVLENRKRAKVRVGDTVETNDVIIHITN